MSNPRRPELSRLNILFCLLVVFIHTASHPVSTLDKLSWQYALVLIPQRLAFVSVFGFFLLSGVKLTLPRERRQTLGGYYKGRIKKLLPPYLLAAAVYYLYFVHIGWYTFSPAQFVRETALGTLSAPFYFLVALAQFILLAPLFSSLAKRWSPVLLLPFALGITWLSSMHFNSILHLFLPGATFPYPDRIFTSYLVYYLAGCCIGQHYQRFTALLADNRKFITALFLSFTAADGGISLLAFSGRRSAPYLEIIHTLYILSAILFLFDLAQRISTPLTRLERQLDHASYLIYLYHCLTIVIFNNTAAQQGITKIGTLFLLRLILVYSITISACVLWQGGAGYIRNQIQNRRQRT